MKISKREQSLLSFLLYVAVVSFAIVFILMPLQSSIDARKALNASLNSQKALVEVEMLNGTGLDQKITDALTEVNLQFSRIESPISSEEFEQKLLPVLVINDIRIKSWIVNDPIISAPNLPTFEKLGYVYKLKELVDSYHGIYVSPSSIPVTDAELVLTNVNFAFTSSYVDYVEVLDAITSWDSTIFVSTSNRDNVTGEAIISIDFYSIEKP
jgi:hypothetical protein